MSDDSLDLQLEKNSLLGEFARRGLDVYQVWQPTPDNPELENRQLRYLLKWVEKYEECHGDREAMEAQGYEFPPVHPCISPDSDWLCFQRWMEGKPVRQTMREHLLSGEEARGEDATAEEFFNKLLAGDPEAMSEEEIEAELERVLDMMEGSQFGLSLNDGLPPRIVYMILREALEDQFEFVSGGFWCIDGCTGVCPECLQRPWCETGGSLCWDEDEKAGEMVVPEPVRRYVSPSPVSLQILRQRQQKESM
ncbi:MAG: hypothetical protein D6681_21845 [Calditrichaeota bacterium]|nr:MAG: hypothetical protein D6681_21845 [Calditrichota bacterium]